MTAAFFLIWETSMSSRTKDVSLYFVYGAGMQIVLLAFFFSYLKVFC